MKFSEQWLRGWVSPQVSRDELVARLSMAGLEVDSVTPAAGVFSGVVVGEVLSTEQHPDADKLLVLKIDTGGGEKEIVAGIARHYQPGELLNKLIVVVDNLEPATIRGITSYGMLLAAQDEAGSLTLLMPERPVAPGSAVR